MIPTLYKEVLSLSSQYLHLLFIFFILLCWFNPQVQACFIAVNSVCSVSFPVHVQVCTLTCFALKLVVCSRFLLTTLHEVKDISFWPKDIVSFVFQKKNFPRTFYTEAQNQRCLYVLYNNMVPCWGFISHPSIVPLILIIAHSVH